MKAGDLRAMSRDDLLKELVDLRREHFNLRMQRATGQLARPHEYGRVKRDIARVKTVLGEMNRAGSSE
ncbi:MAG: 50S ribosomal protein L29 [Woeseiaceae bacterium]|nr:50S ribosomal protein L29 [Woeseiaceae bacterium]